MLGLLPVLPWLDAARSRFIVEHTAWGTARGGFAAGAGSFYGLYIKTFLWGVLLLVLVSMAVASGAALGLSDNLDGTVTEQQAGTFAVTVVLLFYGFGFFVAGYFRARRTNLIMSAVAIGDNGVHSGLRVWSLGWPYLSNTIAIVASLGLAIPWAQIRMARYVAGCTAVDTDRIEQVMAAAESGASAFGEEFGEAFDVDLGL